MADDLNIYTLDDPALTVVTVDDIRDPVISILNQYDDRIRVGQGNDVIILDPAEGLWAGDADFADAPFSVDLQGNVTATTLTVSRIDIPDQDTTANSFHTNSSGDSWWGATETNFNADNDNALAYVLKDGSAKFQNVTITSTPSVPSSITGAVNPVRAYTAGDGFGAGDGCFLASSSTPDYTHVSQGSTAGTFQFGNSLGGGSNEKIADSFSITGNRGISRITTHLKADAGGYSGNLLITIQGDSSGEPDGVPIGTVTVAGSGVSTSYTVVTYDFASLFNVDDGVTYWVVFDSSVPGETYTMYGNTTGNYEYFRSSSWTSDTGTLKFDLINVVTDGNVYLSDASAAATADPFLGLIQTAGDAGDTVQIQISDTFSSLSGLTIGSDYFLTDTPGATGTSAGTVTKKVGRALSATELQILYSL